MTHWLTSSEKESEWLFDEENLVNKDEEKASHHVGRCHLFKACDPVTLVCVIIPTAAE